MKKTINILSILSLVLILVQFVCMFLPYWTLTPVADRVNKDPKPTEYSMQQYCWTETTVMNKIFTKQFKADYDAEYAANDYLIGLVLTSVFGAIAIALLIADVVKVFLKHPGNNTSLLSHISAAAWAGFALYSFFTNFVLTLGTHPMVLTVSIAATVPAAILIVARLVLSVIAFVKNYRAEYCA